MKKDDVCAACGEPVPLGAWPFCPHGRPTYQFNVAMGGGALKKWTHTGSKSPK